MLNFSSDDIARVLQKSKPYGSASLHKSYMISEDDWVIYCQWEHTVSDFADRLSQIDQNFNLIQFMQICKEEI